jgi:fido (protein-threonine AMPylation protein)
MELKIDAAELESTLDLISDFAASDQLKPAEVYKVTWSRYQILQHAKLRAIFDEDNLKKWKTRDVYAFLPRLIHEFIYQGLFTFAGDYRKRTDPGNGIIRFGPQHGHRYSQRFRGDPPEQIVDGVNEAVGHLIWKTQDPLYQAMRFYQKFVNVHPFYDANGRIGRMISNIYLANHELVLSWKDFDGKGKFLNKLNYCHKNPSSESFKFLVNYLRPYLYKIDEEY